MRDDARRVVVTGLGTVNPLGHSVAESWAAAIAGRSGVARLSIFDPSTLLTQFGAEVKDWDPEAYMPFKEARRLDRFAQFFIGASQQAMDDSGLDYSDDEDGARRAGVVLGSGMGGMISFDDQVRVLIDRGPERISPLAVTMIIPNEAAGLASMRFNLQGPVTCVVTACAASANAIGDAAEIVRRGAADVMLAGGAETTLCEFGVGAFNKSRALSTRNDDPAGASRPFDLDRDGFVMGEGAACLILEERQHAVGPRRHHLRRGHRLRHEFRRLPRHPSTPRRRRGGRSNDSCVE